MARNMALQLEHPRVYEPPQPASPAEVGKVERELLSVFALPGPIFGMGCSTGCKYGTGPCTMECMDPEVAVGIAKYEARRKAELGRRLQEEAYRRTVERQQRELEEDYRRRFARPTGIITVADDYPGPSTPSWVGYVGWCMMFVTWGMVLAILANFFLL